ncbi:hypothetical protein G6027_02135 [Dietzia sp. SLG310A2-38A2]|uniref:hypothetical protein n=1 Tax=Dietzia sp. SLG310A2-38A2 TaxID=1630643 RepID=UPI0015F7BFE1|nr:hypothetical protein [Dietzia sp. SLG310A2-38A2]MBB1029711.1 hypothetical protein [Dietzia sp. SLG310A2-38A2]
MSESPQPDQPERDQPGSDARASVDPGTGEDLSWKSTPVAIVLLDRPAPGHREVGDLLAEIFEGSYEVDPGTDDDPATGVSVEDVTVVATPLDLPVADGEASRYTENLAIWNGGESVVDTHCSQVVVAAFRLGPVGDDGEPGEPEYLDPRLETLRCELAVATVTAALTALPGAIAVSVGGAATTLPAGPYRDLVAGNPLPVPALVGVRAGMQSETTSCVYTSGLGRFGRPDMERLDVAGAPGALYGQMCDLIAYSLGSGTVFQPGQALEVGGPQPLLTSIETSPFTGQQVLRLTPG